MRVLRVQLLAGDDRVVTTAGDLVRQFAHFSDVALGRPVVVTKNGRPRNVLISVAEYERLRKRDQRAFFAADTPDEFLRDIEKLARGKT
jgi:prevent-host-death family protein